MKHIIKDFKPESGHHCITTSYKQVLHYYGVAISEEMLFGLGAALNFFYGDFKTFPYPMIGGRINIGKYEEYLADNSMINIEIHETTSIKKARFELYSLIANNIPVPIYVDMAFLDYLKLPEDAHFGGHTVVIFGIDEEEGVAYLSDRDGANHKISNISGVIPRDFHKLPLEQLEKARNSAFKPYPPKNKWITFDLSQYEGITNEAIIKALARNADLMINAPTKNLGLKGINTFSDKVRKWSEYPEEKLKGAVFNSYIMIDQTGGTGGGAFRRMYGSFLIEAAELTGYKGLKEVGKRYIAVSLEWDKVAQLFLEIFTTENRDLFKEVSSRLKGIHNKEVAIWENISQIAN
ncbi:MAG: BtrH N-terminal domain-containing protein [bacterium]